MPYLYLDSSDTNLKSSDSSPSDCTFVLTTETALPNPSYSVQLISASIPNLEPSFQASRNDSFQFFENNLTTLRTATIPEGVYTGSDLATALQTAMNGIGAANTYTVTYSATNKKLTVARSTGTNFRILTSSTCLNELGFDATTLGTSYYTTKTSDFVVNLIGTRYFDIVSSFVTNSVAPNGKRNTLARVYTDVPYGSIINYKADIPHSFEVSAEQLRRIELRLYNERGSLARFNKNQSCQYTLLINDLD